MQPEFCGNDCRIAAVREAAGLYLAAQSIIKRCAVCALDGDLYLLLSGDVLVVRELSLCHKEPQSVAVAAELVYERTGKLAVCLADVNGAVAFKRT